jgi:hypothetical protein
MLLLIARVKIRLQFSERHLIHAANKRNIITKNALMDEDGCEKAYTIPQDSEKAQHSRIRGHGSHPWRAHAQEVNSKRAGKGPGI